MTQDRRTRAPAGGGEGQLSRTGEYSTALQVMIDQLELDLAFLKAGVPNETREAIAPKEAENGVT